MQRFLSFVANGRSFTRNVFLAFAFALFGIGNALAGPTTTALSVTPNPAGKNQTVTMTATVTGSSPTGTVTFKNGSTTLGSSALSGTSAVFTTSFSTTGTKSLTATYNGNAGNSASTSSTVSLTVNTQANTTTALTASPTSVVSGQNVLLTATVSGNNPTGTVSFTDDTTPIGTASISGGVATLNTTLYDVGTTSLTAKYNGNTNNKTSTSPAATVAVSIFTSSLTVSVGTNPLTVGQTATLTATLTAHLFESAYIDFWDGSTYLGRAFTQGNVATLSGVVLAVGTHPIDAGYPGNSSNTPADSPAVNLVVNKANSTTTLSASPNPSAVSQSVTLSASVSGVTPTGTVTFKDGATTIGTGTISSGVATLATSFASSGSHSLTAVYAGNASNNASTSAALTQTVGTATTTALASSVNPTNIAQNTTLTATVTPSSATGTVTFKDGATTIGTGTLSAGVATLATNFSAGGAHSLTAVYAGGGTFAGSTSSTLSQTVNKANSTTTLASSPNPSAVSQSVTLTATVTGTGPTGIVTFKDGAATLGTGTLSAGVATLATSFAASGAHSLTAVYDGDASNNTSTSTALTQTVGSTATTTALTSSVNPSAIAQNTTLTATVTPSTATGTVTFKDGAITIGTGTLSAGVATVSTSFSTTGTHSLTVDYAGGGTFAGSTSAALSQSVNATATTTTLSSTVNPTTVGQNTTLNATVTPTTATGTVTFLEGATTLGTGTLSAGAATLVKSFTSAGSHILTASYGGDSSNAASTSPAGTQTVNPASTSTSLTATPNPTTDGASITLTATLSGGAGPTGNVTFSDGATALGSASVGSGQASLTTSLNGTGAHSLSAAYAGDANNNASTSSALSVQVNGAPPLPPPPSSALPVIDYEYDAQGNRTKVIQAKNTAGFNFATVNTYDALNRAKDSTDARLGVTRLGYDALDRALQVTDPRNLVTQSPRNGLGDVNQLVSPDTGTTNFNSYDAAGNPLTRTDSRGVLATMSYDALNRPTGVVYSQGGQTPQNFVWTYDQTGAGFANGVGRLTSTSHPSGSAQFTYDPQGRVIDDIQRVNAQAGANASQITRTVTYGYDSAGHVASITYPSGRKLSVTYTAGVPSAIGLAKDTVSAATLLISAIQWEPFGAAKSWVWQLAAGTQTHAREFDAAGRPVRYRLGGFVRDITYDAADRISGYSHLDVATATATAGATALNQGFGYDELGRLTGITTASSSWSMGYDANGNRTGLTLNGTASTYTAAPTSNRLNAVTNPARSLGYDSAGNTTSDTGGGYTATYDLAGRMATLVKAGVTTTYSYNGMGQRVRKFGSSGAGSTVVFVYDQGGQLLGEYDQAGNAIREYVWLGSTPIAVFTPDPANSANPPLVYFIHADHLDTPRVVLDRNNNIRWRWMAEPFGTTAPETNPSGLGTFTQNLRFPGQYADSESGLSYNYFRDYDSSTGRYTQSDPIGLTGGINTYAYALGAPTMYTDPMGLFTSSTHNEITTAAIAIAGSPCPNLPAAVANADWFPGSQAPRNAHWHAMRDGTNPNATVDSARRDYSEFVGGQWKTCACEGLARAMHAVQDSYARGHAGFQPWSGGLPSASHAHADAYPSNSEREGAIKASVELIRRYSKDCKDQCPR